MIYKGFEITVVCANNESHDDGSAPVYGDIYDNYNECLADHPDDEIIFGFFIQDWEGDRVKLLSIADAPDWFYRIEDAIEWLDEVLKV